MMSPRNYTKIKAQLPLSCIDTGNFIDYSCYIQDNTWQNFQEDSIVLNLNTKYENNNN